MLDKAPIRQDVFEETRCLSYMSHVSDIRDALRVLVLHFAEDQFKAFAIVRHPERVTLNSRWQIDLVQCSTPLGKLLLKVNVGDVVKIEGCDIVVAAIDGGTVITSDGCESIRIRHKADKLVLKRLAIEDLVSYAESDRGVRNIFKLHERTTKLMQADILNQKEAIPSFSDFAATRSVFRYQRVSSNRSAAQEREYVDYVRLKIQWLKNMA